MTNSLKVSYLGPEGTFTQVAATNYFKQDTGLEPVATIEDVFLAVEQGRADFGVVPVENSTEGAVNNTQDCLVDTSAEIVGEVIVPITHNLMMNGAAEEDATPALIVSHRQSLAQCRQWLNAHYPNVETEEVSSNAKAAQLAADSSEVAAIAGEHAAKLYGLQILHKSIQDKSNNSTRFLVLAKSPKTQLNSNKTSILVYTDNKPGALFRILEPFDSLGISLSKIETRPSKAEAWEYVFFMDFEGDQDSSPVKELFKRLQSCTAEVKILGSYPQYKELS
ncbi:MAG: prephenate dehydratase [Pseudohongiellaceae bacterium]